MVNEKTSPKVARKASAILRSPTATKAAKSAAGSALSQAGTSNVTSKAVAVKAGKILATPKAPAAVKTVAASVLTQKPGKRR